MSYTTDLPATAKRLDRNGDRPRIEQDPEGGYSASDAWIVSFADYPTAMDVINGSAETVSVNSVLGFKYVPLRFKEHAFIIAHRATAEFLPIAPGTSTPAGVIIRVDYRTPEYRVQGSDAWLDVRARSATYPVRMPAGTVMIGSNRNPEPIPWEVGGQQFTVSVRGLQGFNAAAWTTTSTAGILNDDAWRGYPAYTVLFKGPEVSPRTIFGGVTAYDVGFPFQFRAIDWRKDLDSGGSLGNVQYGGTDRYVAVNYTSLFGF